jgi:hypothetical protein
MYVSSRSRCIHPYRRTATCTPYTLDLVHSQASHSSAAQQYRYRKHSMSPCSLARTAARGVRLARPQVSAPSLLTSSLSAWKTTFQEGSCNSRLPIKNTSTVDISSSRRYTSWTPVRAGGQTEWLANSKVLAKTPRTTVTRRAYTTATVENSIPPRSTSSKPPRSSRRRSRVRYLYYLAAFLAITGICYETIPPARHLLIASIRCLRLVKAVGLSVLDYKYTFLDWYPSDKYTEEERKQLARTDRHACHARSSERLFQALKSNAGIYVKLGQHIASIQALPIEWTTSMRPLQDQCYPTSIPKLDAMLRKDMDMGCVRSSYSGVYRRWKVSLTGIFRMYIFQLERSV